MDDMHKRKVERRKDFRIQKSVPIKISSPDEYDAITETKNISASGAYCSLNFKIPEMTRLAVTLLLPCSGKTFAKKIDCKGVVVRVEEKKKFNNNLYNIAIYFNNISKSDKKFIKQYVKRHISRKK